MSDAFECSKKLLLLCRYGEFCDIQKFIVEEKSTKENRQLSLSVLLVLEKASTRNEFYIIHYFYGTPLLGGARFVQDIEAFGAD